ncbi:MAG: DNA polymerase III subunit beta [Bacteroidales bacterium]|nr:DNA polymerase III subunit beta [Bacteroidales bacterium]
MKFIVPSQLLYRNLQTVSGIITTNSAIPIIENVLFQISDKKLRLTATDLETTITTEVELSDADGDMEIVIPAKKVLGTLKELPDVPVIFTISEDFAIEIVVAESNHELIGYNVEEFPQKPELDNVSSFMIDTKILGNAISKTIFATATQDIRPILSGVYFEIKPEDMTFVATDAHKLVCYKHNLNTNLEASFVVPKKPLLLLKNILQSFEGDVQVDFDDTKIAFTMDTVSFVSKLIEGKFPNYNAVIPKNNINILKVERLPLLQDMRRISLYANQSTHLLRMKIEPEFVCLIAEDIETSSKADSKIACVFEYASKQNLSDEEQNLSEDGQGLSENEQEPFEIGFSSKFLQEMLTNIDSDEIIIRLLDSATAGLIFPYYENEEEKQEHLLMLLMPVKLTDPNQ